MDLRRIRSRTATPTAAIAIAFAPLAFASAAHAVLPCQEPSGATGNQADCQACLNGGMGDPNIAYKVRGAGCG
jgi:hypothetical protein